MCKFKGGQACGHNESKCWHDCPSIRSGSDPRQGKESSPLDQQRLSSARTLLDDVVVAVGGVFVIVITIVVVVATIIIEEEMDAFSCPLLTACPVELLIDSEAPGIRNTMR